MTHMHPARTVKVIHGRKWIWRNGVRGEPGGRDVIIMIKNGASLFMTIGCNDAHSLPGAKALIVTAMIMPLLPIIDPAPETQDPIKDVGAPAASLKLACFVLTLCSA